MSKYLSVVSVCAFFFLMEDQAFAYLDPGSGSIMLQVILGGLAGVALVIKVYFNHIRNFFSFSKKNKAKKEIPAEK